MPNYIQDSKVHKWQCVIWKWRPSRRFVMRDWQASKRNPDNDILPFRPSDFQSNSDSLSALDVYNVYR